MSHRPTPSAPELRRLVRAALVGAAAMALAACAKDIDARGNLPTDDSLSKLAPGEQTRQDVRNLLGTPSTTSVFDGETWYYISAQTTQYAFYPVEELERSVYKVNFDQRGILRDVTKLDLNDGREVQIVARETPSKGRELSLIEQLIGNLGRFNSGREAQGPR
ncbi:MAG: outer membrane protein assembly factor BamE [Rhodospirillaceae bacterium]|nr:outer membrane protein assembly factor BamE [Rhodospirillaceae bacterium]